MGLKIILTLISLLIIPMVLAEYDFSANYEVVKNSITRDDVAEFDITITNHKIYDDRFRFNFVFDPKWSYQTMPNYLSGIEIKAKSDKIVKLYVYPNKVVTGQSVVRVGIESESTGTEVNLFPVINLRSPFEVKEYEEDIGVKVEFPNEGKIDPRGEATIKVELKNKNLLYIEDLTLNLESSLINAEKAGINFKPLERKYIEFNVKFDPKEPPKKETLTVTWRTKNNTIGTQEEEYEIIGYELPFVKEEDTEKGLLFSTEYTILTNKGTLAKEEDVEVATSWIKTLISTSNTDYTTTAKDGKRYIVIKAGLEPDETKEVYVRTHYWIPALAVIIILTIIYLYYKLRSPILVHKKAFVTATEEGGISEIKTLINIKNRGKANVSEIKVSDVIPKIAELQKEFGVGTLKPTKIFKHKTKGIIVKWDVDLLERFEERILSYKIKSRLSILGGLTLPSATARFKYLNRERRTKSNKAWMKL